MSPWGRCQLSLVSLASVLFSCLQCLGHCLAKPKQICSAWYPVSSFWTFFSLQNDQVLCSQQLWVVFTLLLSETYWGQRSPITLCVTPAQDPFLWAWDLKVTGRVSRTCQNYRDPSVDRGGTAGKSVMDQKQMTLQPWNPFTSRSWLTFSKV